MGSKGNQERRGAPDGKILYKGGGRDLWTMNPDGSGAAKIDYNCPTVNGGVCDNAVGDAIFSPDGTKIAAEYFGDIFVIPPGGGQASVIRGSQEDGYPGQELDPAWSPDGEKIAFEHDGNVPGSPYAIYTANADGSSTTATQITSTGVANPDWQPIVPKLAVNDVRVKEKTTTARFTVTLSGASEQSVTVDYATANGTAKAPADYTTTTGTLTFEPGQTTQTIPVPVRGDRRDERTEAFFVNLSGQANTTVADTSGKGTIVDND